ncbi:unnamed protein product [Schistosoma intercalatum]|nr:unnamed protein product [Schistosoma intercalatum]
MAADKAIMPNNEFFDDPEEGSGFGGTTLRSGKSASRDVQNHRDQPKRARTDEDASSSTTKSNSKEGSGSKKSDSTSDKRSESKSDFVEKMEVDLSKKANGLIEPERAAN